MGSQRCFMGSQRFMGAGSTSLIRNCGTARSGVKDSQSTSPVWPRILLVAAHCYWQIEVCSLRPISKLVPCSNVTRITVTAVHELRPPLMRVFRGPRLRGSRSSLCMRERRDRLWIPFELSSSGRGRQSRLRELPLFEGPGDSSGTAILPIFVPRFLLDNIQAKHQPQHDGVFALPADYDPYLVAFPVRDLWGIGPRYAAMLARHGLHTALDLKQAPDSFIRQKMTVVGHRLLQELRGVSCLLLEEVEPQRKSICCSRSFGRGIAELTELREAVCSYITRAAEKLRRRKLAASYLSVFIRTNQFNADPKYSDGRGATISPATNNTLKLNHLKLKRFTFIRSRIFNRTYIHQGAR